MQKAFLKHFFTDGSDDQSATQRAYLALRRMILIGEIAPQHKLKVDDLRQILDLGASPIREALSLLVADQLVVRLDQRGFVVAEISRENFEEILSLRCIVEERALRLSIANKDAVLEETIILAQHRMDRCEISGVDDFDKHHKEFHLALISKCDSPVLLGYCEQLYDLNIRYRNLAAKKPNYQKRNVIAEHQGILEATIDGDADLATRRLINHYRQTGSILTSLFEETECLSA